jgi:hypothetical protein
MDSNNNVNLREELKKLGLNTDGINELLWLRLEEQLKVSVPPSDSNGDDKAYGSFVTHYNTTRDPNVGEGEIALRNILTRYWRDHKNCARDPVRHISEESQLREMIKEYRPNTVLVRQWNMLQAETADHELELDTLYSIARNPNAYITQFKSELMLRGCVEWLITEISKFQVSLQMASLMIDYEAMCKTFNDLSDVDNLRWCMFEGNRKKTFDEMVMKLCVLLNLDYNLDYYDAALPWYLMYMLTCDTSLRNVSVIQIADFLAEHNGSPCQTFSDFCFKMSQSYYLPVSVKELTLSQNFTVTVKFLGLTGNAMSSSKRKAFQEAFCDLRRVFSNVLDEKICRKLPP